MFLIFTFKPLKIIIMILLIIFFSLLLVNYRYISLPSYTRDMEFKVVIDAGHGSVDTGTSYNDVLEKDINLQIAKHLYEDLKNVNIIPIMTRTEDILYENSRNKDLRHRPIVANNSQADLFISIHANNYPSSQPSGSQIFYKINSNDSELLAEFIQDELVKLRKENNRALKKGDYYVLNLIKCPGILIEVGFLSNPEDRNLLTNPDYQKQLSSAIKDGIINYFQESFNKNTEKSETSNSDYVNKDISSTKNNNILYYLYTTGEQIYLIKKKISFPTANFFNEKYQLHNFNEIMAISAIEQLLNPPSGLSSPLPLESSINHLEIEENILKLDLSKEAVENFNGGFDQELMAVNALLKTLFSIDGVKGIEILIDGKSKQSLGGHIIFDQSYYQEFDY